MATSRRSAPAVAADGVASSLAGLEIAVSALVRWSESKHIRAEVARMSGCDIAPSVIRLLEHFDLSGPMRVSEVARCLGIDISTASLQLRPLKQKGLVDSTRDPQDGRIATISITPKGRDVLARVRGARQELLAEAFGDTPAAEISRAAATLLRVQDVMLAGGR
jgi:DNA-binding MarR family transcriptional regulator